MQQELTPDEVEALLNYQAITENYDQERGIQLLQANNWDPMAAAQDYFASIVVDNRREQVVREEAKAYYPPSQSLVEEDNSGIASKVWSGIVDIGSSITSMFSGFFASPEATSTTSGGFLTKLKATYPELDFPEFSPLSLQALLPHVRESRRPLIFYVHNETASDEFVSQVLCSEVIVDMLSHSFVIWGTFNTSSEGRSMIKNLRARTTPTFAACRISQEPDPIVLEVIEGEVSLEDMFNFLERNLMLHREQLNSISRPARPADPVVDRDRSIREQQEIEYREVERQYLEQQRAKQAEDERARAEQERQRSENERRKIERSRIIESVGPEPNPGTDVAEVVIRLPDGSRNIRRFMRSSTLRQLFDYISTLEGSVPKQYEVVTTYPTTTLHPTQDTIESAGLFPKAIVHVREQLAN
eukprot:CAMPEP_0204899346 /NCGR_PEP_ID=MMETSP1397-20131031/1803_1 /ASSEMBLY_ACC=CAM_ASM_000891 /TAXON_ID=49980 /ORGANISM="Climacostomum Climacostomum virens, Strain Stock W-24" /LENGTH=414 /DNA_ID=CAMNT_0052067297 /DNA_START=2362 /DNA_END=3606 /DNA_ORIENTATION=+